MPDFDPPTGEPASTQPPLTEEQQRMLAVQRAYIEALAQKFQNAQRGERPGHGPIGVRIILDLNMMTAASVCAAVNFMEQDVVGFEDEDMEAAAEAVASDLFHTLAVRVRDVVLPVLGNRGIATPPEMFMQNVGAIQTAIAEFTEEEGDDDVEDS